MSDSAPSPIFKATSPAQAPAPPVINSVRFSGLKATINLNLPEGDADGNLYPSVMNFAGVKIFFGPTGILTPEPVPVDFPAPGPGSYLPGQAHEFEVDVPAWSTTYDFEAEVSI